MEITPATRADVGETAACWAAAFAQDPITTFLLQPGPAYPARVAQFFSLLMRARLALGMPVLVARSDEGIQGGAMGYATSPPPWPEEVARDWDSFEATIPGLADRMAVYDAISDPAKPTVPHYYLGVLGVAPALHGQGLGLRLLQAFCDRSAQDPASRGVYLETASPANVRFYERAGFVETGRGALSAATLWCMFRQAW